MSINNKHPFILGILLLSVLGLAFSDETVNSQVKSHSSTDQVSSVDISEAQILKEEFKEGVLKLLSDAGIELPSKEEIMKRLEEVVLEGLPKEAKQTPQEIIEGHGLTFEKHKIHTEDHYILTAFRVFNKDNNNHKPIILQHGLVDDAFTWFIPSWEGNIIKMLTDAGYELWLTNSRGNRYSFEHETLTLKDKAFWNFSFHEMGVYD